VVAVRAYQLLPEAAVTLFANALPFVEIGLGLLLLAGVGVRPTAVVSAALLVVFMAGVASAWARGLSHRLRVLRRRGRCAGRGGGLPD